MSKAAPTQRTFAEIQAEIDKLQKEAEELREAEVATLRATAESLGYVLTKKGEKPKAKSGTSADRPTTDAVVAWLQSELAKGSVAKADLLTAYKAKFGGGRLRLDFYDGSNKRSKILAVVKVKDDKVSLVK